MPLQLLDEEKAALEAALEDAASANTSTPAVPPPAASDGLAPPSPELLNGWDEVNESELQLDAELDQLLLGALSPSHSVAVSDPDPEGNAMRAGEQLTQPSRSDSRRGLLFPSPLPVLGDANHPLSKAAGAVSLPSKGGRPRRGASGEVGRMRRQRIKSDPNKARNERKQELAFLRVKVQQLESELSALQRHGGASTSTTRSTSTVLSTPSCTASAQALKVWRSLAQRQLQRREGAERENARLKLVLESQLKLATSMERLLQRRAQQQLAGCADVLQGVGANCAGPMQGRTLDFLMDRDTFEALLEGVDTAYSEVDMVLAHNGLNRSDRPDSSAQMREGANGMYLDLFGCKLLPFEFDITAPAVWEHFRGNAKHRGNLYHNATTNLDSSVDTVMEDFVMEFLGKTTRADFRVKQVVRRYVEEDRQVVVWVSKGQALEQTTDTSPFASFCFVDKGYAVVKRPEAPALRREGFSVLQICSLVSPQMAENCSLDRTDVGAFTEFVMNVVAANIRMDQEVIENVLLDRATQQAAAN